MDLKNEQKQATMVASYNAMNFPANKSNALIDVVKNIMTSLQIQPKQKILKKEQKKVTMVASHNALDFSADESNALSDLDSNYAISNQLFCTSRERPVEVLIAIPSGVKNFNRRQRNRRLLEKEPLEEFQVGYVLFVALDVSYNNQVMEESHSNGDIVQGAFVDHYRNMTRKSILILHWIKTYCNGVKYVIKMDDDMVYNLTNLFHYMTHMYIPPSDFIMGNMNINGLPHRNPKRKWYLSKEEFPLEHFPDFVFGGAYILFGNLTERLWKATFEVPYIWLEDVFVTGLCREAAGISLKASKFPFFCRGKNPYTLMRRLGCSFVHSY